MTGMRQETSFSQQMLQPQRKKGFEPIGTNDNPYKGNFNGKGHTVTLDITSGTKI